MADSALRNRPSGRHSELHAWMAENYAALSGEPINWRWLMREIKSRGLTNRKGEPVVLGTAKRTWFRVASAMRSGCQPMRATKPEERPALSTRIVQPSTERAPGPTTFGFATVRRKE